MELGAGNSESLGKVIITPEGRPEFRTWYPLSNMDVEVYTHYICVPYARNLEKGGSHCLAGLLAWWDWWVSVSQPKWGIGENMYVQVWLHVFIEARSQLSVLQMLSSTLPVNSCSQALKYNILYFQFKKYNFWGVIFISHFLFSLQDLQYTNFSLYFFIFWLIYLFYSTLTAPKPSPLPDSVLIPQSTPPAFSLGKDGSPMNINKGGETEDDSTERDNRKERHSGSGKTLEKGNLPGTLFSFKFMAFLLLLLLLTGLYA